MRRKGFLHIVEAVVVVILIMLTLSQFFYFSPKQTYWEQLGLERLSRDILFTLSKTENTSIVFNESLLRSKIREILPGGSLSNIDFSASVEGAIMPKIRIACNCTEAQRADLGVILNRSLDFNNRTVLFDINRNIKIEDVNRFTDIDIFLIYGHKNFTEPEVNELLKFLEKGKGVMEVSNLSGVQIHDNNMAIFPMKRVENSISSTGTDDIIFKNTKYARSTNYKIPEYFYNIPANVKVNETDSANPEICGGNLKVGVVQFNNIAHKTSACVNPKQVYIDYNDNEIYGEGEGPFVPGDSITIGSYNYIVRSVDPNGRYYTLDISDEFKFSNYADSNLKVNATNQEYTILALNRTYCSGSDCGMGNVATLVATDKLEITEFRGRSLWMQNFTGTDYEHLLKTSIAWTTGTRNQIIRNTDIKPGAIGSEYYINYYGDLFEPTKVILTLWYVF